MPSKKTLAMFDDIRQVLDQAVAASGGTFVCETHGVAVHWRQRAYQFRKLFREKVGGETSPYDRLTFKKVEAESCEIIIAIIQTPGNFIPANPAAPDDDDPLLQEALDLAKNIL